MHWHSCVLSMAAEEVNDFFFFELKLVMKTKFLIIKVKSVIYLKKKTVDRYLNCFKKVLIRISPLKRRFENF